MQENSQVYLTYQSLEEQWEFIEKIRDEWYITEIQAEKLLEQIGEVQCSLRNLMELQ